MSTAEKEINHWIDKLGMETHFEEGFRVTDKDTMEVVEMVLNRVNKYLVQMVEHLGVKAIGICGKDGDMLHVKKKMPNGKDIGYVGDVDTVTTDILDTLLENDYIPIIAPIGMDDKEKLIILMQMTPHVLLFTHPCRKACVPDRCGRGMYEPRGFFFPCPGVKPD